MMADIAAGSLPAVTFFKPIGEQNEHPGYADVLEGDTHAAGIIKAIQDSPLWKDSVIIVTYDENGGLWDHVAPPATDKWGPGTRVPTIIISPFAKKGFIDHTVYDTTSILKLIETRYGLVPLGTRDAGAADLSNALALQ
jgi:phospholipase C